MIHLRAMRFPACEAAQALTQQTSGGLPPLHEWPAALEVAAQLCLGASTPMLLLWGRTDIVVYNQPALDLLGSGALPGMGRPLRESGHELAALVARVAADVRRHQRGASRGVALCLRRGLHDVETWLRLCGSPLRDERGVPAGVLCLVQETTARQLHERRAATVLALGERLWRLGAAEPLLAEVQCALETNALDFARMAMLQRRPDGAVVTRWSTPAGFADGLAPEVVAEVLGDDVPAAGDGRRVRALGERRFALLAPGEPLLQGSRFALVVEPDDRVCVDSRYRGFLRFIGDTILGAASRVLCDRRALGDMRLELNERDRLYRALFEHSHDGALICSPGGRILAANPAACRTLGYREDEIQALGRDGFVLDADGTLTSALASRSRDGKFVGALTFRRKDGAAMKVDVSSTLFEDQATGQGRAVVFFRDAAPRLAAQQRIAATARLNAVGELTGGIAHDFNNLLNVVIDGAERLAERLAADPTAQREAQLVLEASLRAAGVTRQLLAFSRQQPMKTSVITLGAAMEEMEPMLHSAIGPGIDMRLELDHDLEVVADAALLQSAVLNLCLNARDALPDGGHVTITAGATDVDASLAVTLGLTAGPHAILTVEDDGTGIPEEHMGRIFDPFFTTKPAGQGTGLGLSSVLGFMRQSNGALRVRSTAGAGTAVDLYFPRPEERVPESGSPSPRRVTGTVPDRSRPSNLLLVEDERLLASMLSMILEGAGYGVTVCPSGEAALEALDQRGPFDLMLTDIMLGAGLDGWTLAERVRARRPDMPIVTMSGFAPATGGAGSWNGVTLIKPFRPGQILDVVATQLGSLPGLSAG